MPNRILRPHPDTCIATRPGFELFAKDLQEDYPLYRGIKLICAEPWHEARRTAHLAWIVHESRLRSGGDGWIMAKNYPDLREWISTECAALFDARYVIDTFGFSEAEYEELVAKERARYSA